MGAGIGRIMSSMTRLCRLARRPWSKGRRTSCRRRPPSRTCARGRGRAKESERKRAVALVVIVALGVGAAPGLLDPSPRKHKFMRGCSRERAHNNVSNAYASSISRARPLRGRTCIHCAGAAGRLFAMRTAPSPCLPSSVCPSSLHRAPGSPPPRGVRPPLTLHGLG